MGKDASPGGLTGLLRRMTGAGGETPAAAADAPRREPKPRAKAETEDDLPTDDEIAGPPDEDDAHAPRLADRDWSEDDEDDAWPAAPEPDEPARLAPETWDQSVPVYAALAAHREARETKDALRAAIDAVNARPRAYWRRRTRRLFDQIVERNIYGAGAPPPPGRLRSFDLLSDAKTQYTLTRGINWYACNHGFEPSLLRPRRFTEKLLVAKFFAPVPMPSPGDKLGVEAYIPPAWRALVSAAPRVWESHLPAVPREIDAPPGVYYLKANHASGANLKLTLPFDDAAHAEAEAFAAKWLKADYGWRGGEWWYQPIRRKVFLEQSFSDHGASEPDWKIFVLGGKAALVQVDLDRDQNHVQLLYDREFTFLPAELFFPSGEPIGKPANYDDLIGAAEAIGRQFEFARVDLYNTPNGIVLGEITLAPGGGRLRLRSPELDLWMGDEWRSSLFRRRGGG